MSWLGIDFGSTNTVVAFAATKDAHSIEYIEFPNKKVYDRIPVLPSEYENLESIVSKSQKFFDRLKSIFRYKKQIRIKSYLDMPFTQKRYTDIKRQIYSAKNNKLLEYKKVMHLFLENLKKQVEEKINDKIEKIVFSYPILNEKDSHIKGEQFHRILEEVTKKVFSEIEIEYFDEVACSALSYGIEGNYICIVDIGGSTTSLSVVKLENNTSVIFTSQSFAFGGKDIDEIISNNTKFDLRKAEEIKIQLSNSESTELEGRNFYRNDLEEWISKEGYYEVIKNEIGKIFEELNSRRIQKEELSHLIFVGGTTKIPSIKKAIIDKFKVHNPDIINEDGNVFGSVSHGGALLSTGIKKNPYLNYFYGIRVINEGQKRNDYQIIFWGNSQSKIGDMKKAEFIRFISEKAEETIYYPIELSIHEFNLDDLTATFQAGNPVYNVNNDKHGVLVGNVEFSKVIQPNFVLKFFITEDKDLRVTIYYDKEVGSEYNDEFICKVR
ncbi:MAG: Hsp70 family protein [Leptospiraceae bacterium]|nr:Hsp70 family protein [Leptospiraceae bacterium]